MEQNQMILIGGVYENKKENGEIYFKSGRVGVVNFLLFKNKRKESNRDPDYWLMMAQAPKQDQNTAFGQAEKPRPPQGNDPLDVPF